MDLSIDANSWLNLTNLLQSGEYIFWDQTEYPDIPLTVGDQYIQLTQQQASRIDLLAFDTYGDPVLLWVIMLANNIDYPSQMYEGMVIRLPAQDTIDSILQPNT